MDECVRMLDHMPDRTPVNGTFELTIRCNLHCKMCLFRHDDSENAEIMAKELTAEQWIDMGRQVAEAGTLNLLITGGEPLLRSDFCEIWEGIYKQGFIISLYTNATLITPEVFETLQKYPPHRIGITVYGASPEVYKKVTGSADAFEEMKRGVRLLQKLPSKIEYRMTVIKDNYDDVSAVESIVKDLFNSMTPLIHTRIVTKAVRGACSDVEQCRLPAEKNIELYLDRTVREIKDIIKERFDEGHVIVQAAEQHQGNSDDVMLTLFGCKAGITDYAVSWNGLLMGCQLMEEFAQEIESSFLGAWERFPTGVQLPELPSDCHECTYQEFCSVCPAFIHAETGSFGKRPDYICADSQAVYELCRGKYDNCTGHRKEIM